MFEVENKYYNDNREVIREKYLGKSIAIVKDTIIGVYNDIGEAYKETLKTRKPGTFCLKNIPINPKEAFIEDHPRLSPINWSAHALPL